jgi:hypothetical protein
VVGLDAMAFLTRSSSIIAMHVVGRVVRP